MEEDDHRSLPRLPALQGSAIQRQRSRESSLPKSVHVSELIELHRGLRFHEPLHREKVKRDRPPLGSKPGRWRRVPRR